MCVFSVCVCVCMFRYHCLKTCYLSNFLYFHSKKLFAKYFMQEFLGNFFVHNLFAMKIKYIISWIHINVYIDR